MNCKDYRIVISCSDSCRCSSLGGGILQCIRLFCNTWDSGGDNNVTKDTIRVSTETVTVKAQSSSERVSAFNAEILRCRLYCNAAYEQRGFLYHTCTNVRISEYSRISGCCYRNNAIKTDWHTSLLIIERCHASVKLQNKSLFS